MARSSIAMPAIEQSARAVLTPKAGCPWAETAVLNPAIVKDPTRNVIHMLFRATGPFAHRQSPGKPIPYPIFLGYAVSRDGGATWDADFSGPALAPALESAIERLYVKDRGGKPLVNYANGCIEDPRFMRVEGTLYLTAACRMFPPGAYWIQDDPMQCAPDWAKDGRHPFGRAASENVTVTVIYRVDLDRLSNKNYTEAFEYLGPITNTDYGENRDAFLFSERVEIQGRRQYVALHRPWEGSRIPGGRQDMKPSIWIASAERIEDLHTSRAEHQLLAEPLFDWETERIGASWPPIRIGTGEWLLPYHGKKDRVNGYTQSFMILRQEQNGRLCVVHRCPERLMYAKHPWELDRSVFATPCVFTTGGFVENGTLIMAYGAADRFIGVATAPFDELVSFVRQFDASGQRLSGG